MELDFVGSMHTGWESYEKTEIDNCSNIEAAKQLVREKVHTIELIEKNNAKNLTAFCVLNDCDCYTRVFICNNAKATCCTGKDG